MWSLNSGCSNLPLYQFSQRSEEEEDRFFSATVRDDEIFASCHCDKCELVMCEGNWHSFIIEYYD